VRRNRISGQGIVSREFCREANFPRHLYGGVRVWLHESNMNNTIKILTMALALGMSAGMTKAQDPGSPPRRGGGPPGGARGGGLDFSSTPLPKDEAEKKILSVLDDMSRQGRGMMSVPRDDGRLLRMLAESIGAKTAVEIGTSQGYSAIWTCLALRSTGGKLTTFEIDKERAAQARANFKRAGVDALVTLIEGDAHVEVAKLKDPIDLVFIDADKEGYLDYLNKLLPLVRPGGLIVAHNMTARQADPNFVKASTTNPNLEALFLTTGNSGIEVMLKKR